MYIELKKAIMLWLFDNSKEFQIHSACTKQFRPYIFDSNGQYLIGGEDVSKFIEDAIKLIR